MKTRNTKKRSKVVTIPQLRASFEQIDKIAMELKGKSKETQIKEFRAAWKKIFYRDVSDTAIESYLAVKHSEKSSSKRTTRRRSKQKGGMAPLDYQTRPGIDGVYGNYPAYIGSGFSFGNHINQARGPTQAGGDLVRALAFSPIQSTSPPGILQTALSTFAGEREPISSAVEHAAWQKN
jgi:hypothetical protein